VVTAGWKRWKKLLGSTGANRQVSILYNKEVTLDVKDNTGFMRRYGKLEQAI